MLLQSARSRQLGRLREGERTTFLNKSARPEYTTTAPEPHGFRAEIYLAEYVLNSASTGLGQYKLDKLIHHLPFCHQLRTTPRHRLGYWPEGLA